MEIYLIRHTTPLIEKGVCYGQANLELADTYQEEITTIISKLKISKDSVVYSSPLKRCALLAEKINSTVFYEESLKELNFGDWELLAWDAIEQTSLNKWMADFVTEKVPNGESYLELKNRSIHLFKKILQKNHQQIFIVTHAGVMRAILADILKMKLKDSFSIKLDYGAIVKLEFLKEKLSIKSGLLITN